jgi:hypothetical protein
MKLILTIYRPACIIRYNFELHADVKTNENVSLSFDLSLYLTISPVHFMLGEKIKRPVIV